MSIKRIKANWYMKKCETACFFGYSWHEVMKKYNRWKEENGD